MTSFIERQFQANLKANIELIDLCATLTNEQLAVEVEGIYGRIKPLITHIIQGEGNGLRDLVGTSPWPDDLDRNNLTFEQLRHCWCAEKCVQCLAKGLGVHHPIV